MADKTLEVKINARDNASAAFAKVGDSAKTMGDAIAKAGDSGVKSFTAQVQALESEISTLGKTAAGVGGVITSAFAAPMAAGTKMAFDQVRAIEDATSAMNVFERDAAKTQTVLTDLLAYARSPESGGRIWSQDLYAAAQHLQLMGAETEKLTDYVKVMSRSVGLGTGTWNELNQVIGRVGSTGKLTGVEFDNLAKLGFRLDTSLRNTTVTWDELFAALGRAIPEDALIGQFDTIGTGIEYFKSSLIGLGQEILKIDTETGRFIDDGLGDRMVKGLHQATDLMSSMSGAAGLLGDALGVVAGTASFFIDGFLGLPDIVQTAIFTFNGLAGAVTLAGGAFLLALPRILAVKKAVDTLAASTGAFGLLGRGITALMGPWGLAVAGVTAALTVGMAAWGKYRRHVEETTAAIEGITEAWAETDRLLAELPAAASARVALEMSAVQNAIADFTTSARDYRLELGDILAMPDENQAQRLGDSITQMLDSEIGGAFTRWAERNRETLGEDLFTAIMNREHLDIYAQDILAAWDGFLDDIEMSVTERTGLEVAMQEFWARVFEPGTNARPAIEAYKLIMDEFERTGDVDAFSESLGRLNERLDAGEFSAERYGDALSRALDKIDAAYERADEIDAELTARIAARMQRIHDFTSKVMELQGIEDPFHQWNLTDRATEFTTLAENIRQTGDAIDSTFRIIVGNTDAIKKQADDVKSWADELINVRGELGRIDELVEKGLITGTSGVFGDGSQYAAAQDAYDSIAKSTEQIHDNLDAVQAIQAPLMASLLESQAAYTEELRKMPAEQQMIALGWMDAATAAKALEVNTLAASIANNELGESGRIAFENLIDNIVRTDPFLASMLEDMQLLDNVVRDQDGRIISYDIDLKGAKAANSEIAELTRSIDALTLALGGVPPDHEITVGVAGKDELDATTDALEQVTLADGTVVEIKTEVDTDDWDQLTAADLANRFANDPVQLPVEAVIEPMDDVTPEQWNNMLGPFPEIDVPVKPEGVSDEEWQTAVGVPPTITTPVDADTSQLESDIAAVGTDAPPLEIPVTLKRAVTGAADWITGALGSLFGGVGQAGGESAAITIEAIDNATPVLEEIRGVIEATDVAITVSTPGAIPSLVQLTAVKAAVEAVPDEAHIDVAALYWDTVIGDLGKVKGAADDVPDDVTIAVGTIGAEATIGTLYAVANAANAIPTSITSTITTNLVTNRISNSRHGGIPGYAHGGVIAELAEAGPELLHFAGGGVAPVFTRGLYDVPPGTYVSPNNANSQMQPVTVQGGDTYEIHVHGNIYGIDDLASALESAVVQRRAGFGGVA